MRVSDRIFLASSLIVALSTLAFPHVRGYGTILFQAVVLLPWSIVAMRSPESLLSDLTCRRRCPSEQLMPKAR
jgi:hypothetical protein